MRATLPRLMAPEIVGVKLMLSFTEVMVLPMASTPVKVMAVPVAVAVAAWFMVTFPPEMPVMRVPTGMLAPVISWPTTRPALPVRVRVLLPAVVLPVIAVPP